MAPLIGPPVRRTVGPMSNPFDSVRQGGGRHRRTAVVEDHAAGKQVEDIVKSYPLITRQSVQAAVGYAADLQWACRRVRGQQLMRDA